MKHQKHIKRCLQLAKKGLGTTAPNPMVGAVLVYQDLIIGEGYTSPFGKAHAEVNCINSVKEENKHLIKKSTLYVSLEPCSHFGKTPPCSHLIVKSKIKKIVIGTLDTNKLVSGKGISFLEEHNCKVTIGILEAECQEINKRFFTFHQKKRPYIILKWAVSSDGFIGQNTKDKQEPIWISTIHSRQLVHLWRGQEQAIMVGTTTAIVDNPKLDVRHIKAKNPIRIVLDRQLRIPKNHYLLDDSIKTIIFTSSSETVSNENTIYEQIDFSKNVPMQVCTILYKHEIQSIIIEGGRQTLQSFIDANLWDESYVFHSKIRLKKGIKTPILKTKKRIEKYISNNKLIISKNGQH